MFSPLLGVGTVPVRVWWVGYGAELTIRFGGVEKDFGGELHLLLVGGGVGRKGGGGCSGCASSVGGGYRTYILWRRTGIGADATFEKGHD